MNNYSFINQYNQAELWLNFDQLKITQSLIAQIFPVTILSCSLLNIAQSSSESNSIGEQCLIPI
jgi:hypothetical protein